MRLRAAAALLFLLVSCSHAAGPVADAGPADAADAGPDSSEDTGDATMVLVGPSGDHSFLPVALTIPVGTTVRWFWESTGHNVVSGPEGVADGDFCSPRDSDCASAPVSQAGAVYEHTFTKRGTFPYFCAPHYSVGMKGTITVK